MNPSYELVALIQGERLHQAQRSRLERIAACARACCAAPAGLIERFMRVARPAPQSC